MTSDKQRSRPAAPARSLAEPSAILLALYVGSLPLLGGYFEEPLQGTFLQDCGPSILRGVLLLSAGARVIELRRPGARPWRGSVPLPAGLFLVWSIIAATLGPSWQSAYDPLRLTGAALLTYLLTSDVCGDSAGRNLVLGAALAGAALTGAWGIAEYTRTVHSGGDLTWRIFSTFQGPNLLAAYLLPCLLVGLASLLTAERPWLLPATAATVFTGIALLLTGSRGAVLYSLPVAVALWLAYSHLSLDPGDPAGVRRRQVRLAAILVVGVGLALAVMRPTAARVGRSASTGDVNSTRFRSLTWRGTLHMIRDRPLSGVGPGNWVYVYPRYALAGYSRAAHNGYLQTAAELGIPGVALWLWLLAAGFGRPRRGDWMEAGRSSALMAAMLHNGVDYGWLLFAPLMLTWVLLGTRPVNPAAVKGPSDRPWIRRFEVLSLGLAILLTALGLTGVSAEAAGMSARTALQEGDARAAMGAFGVAGLWEPLDDLWPDQQSKVALYLEHDPKSAVGYAHQAIGRRPLKASLYYRLALAERAAGQTDAARRDLETAVRMDPHATAGLMALADLEAGTAHPDRAVQLYRQVADLQTSSVGQVKALAEMEDPNYTIARERLAEDASRRGDRDELARQVRLGLKTSQAYLDGLKIWGPILEAQGRDDRPERDRVEAARDRFRQWRAAAGTSRH